MATGPKSTAVQGGVIWSQINYPHTCPTRAAHPSRAHGWEGFPCTRGLAGGLQPGAGPLRDSPTPGGRSTGIISRSQRAPAPLGPETFQQNVRAKGNSCVSTSGDCPGSGCPRGVEPPPAPQNGHFGASTAWVGVRSWPYTHSSGIPPALPGPSYPMCIPHSVPVGHPPISGPRL